jgi:hypothetical protein
MTTIIAAPVGTAAPAAPVSSGFISGMFDTFASVGKVLSSEPTQYIDNVTVGRAIAVSFIGGIALGGRRKDDFPTFLVGN